MRRKVEVMDYASEIIKKIGTGALLTTKAEKVNTMTIGWGSLGIEWNLPVFTAYVRKSRFTYDQLEENGEFTVNIPMGDYDRKIIAYCGYKSGRDSDKIKDMKLTLDEDGSFSVPGIKEFPLTLECRVLYKKEQTMKEIDAVPRKKFYGNADNEMDMHVEYIAEIVSAYIIEE